MSLADKRRQGPPRPRRMQCGVAKVLAALHPAEADELAEMIGDPAWKGSQIAEAYTEDYPDLPPLKAEAINRHRKKDCNCEPR